MDLTKDAAAHYEEEKGMMERLKENAWLNPKNFIVKINELVDAVNWLTQYSPGRRPEPSSTQDEIDFDCRVFDMVEHKMKLFREQRLEQLEKLEKVLYAYRSLVQEQTSGFIATYEELKFDEEFTKLKELL